MLNRELFLVYLRGFEDVVVNMGLLVYILDTPLNPPAI
jgi:hypothetical protein